MKFWGFRIGRRITALALAISLAEGCHHSRPDAHYLGEASESYYQDHSTEVEYPTETWEMTPPEVTETAPPHTIRDAHEAEIREITLAEAVHLSLTNSAVIRTRGTFLSPGNPLYTNPDRVDSVFDPAIQNSGVLFGGKGVEAALAAFDAQLNAAMIWNRNEEITNVASFNGVPGGTLNTEGANFVAELQKTFGYGGTMTLSHDVNYLGRNVDPANVLFNSHYFGNVALQYRQPLLAGAGTEYTRIAGPIAQGFGGITGVSQGVIISRINNDIAIADLDGAVQTLLRDVEDAYWDLYYAYRAYDTAVQTRASTLGIWEKERTKKEAGAGLADALSQAQDQLFATETATNNTWSNLLTSEVRLRRLLGLPVNDGTLLRPHDEPITAQLIPDWYSSLTEALTHRVELRRQKWNIKSLELQLRAARSLTKPRLDLVGGYQVNGFGDNLLAYDDNDLPNSGVPTAQGLNSFYETITQGNQTGWNVGVQMNMPFGFRSARAQVTNYELRLAKGQKVLQEQEKEVSLELAASFQEVARAYNAAETNLNRVYAAQENVRVWTERVEEGAEEADPQLRAILRLADAEVAYYQSLVDYNKALNALQFYKGTILRHNSISLSEGPWVTEAYQDAEHHADARAHAFTNDWLHHEPEAFSTQAPTSSVHFTADAAAQPAVDAAIPSEPAPLPEPSAPQPAPAPIPPVEVPAVPPTMIEQQSWRTPATVPAWVSPVTYEAPRVPSRPVPAPAATSAEASVIARPVSPSPSAALPTAASPGTNSAVAPARSSNNKGGSSKQ